MFWKKQNRTFFVCLATADSVLSVFCQPTAGGYSSAHVNDLELVKIYILWCFLYKYFVEKTLVQIALSTLSC